MLHHAVIAVVPTVHFHHPAVVVVARLPAVEPLPALDQPAVGAER